MGEKGSWESEQQGNIKTDRYLTYALRPTVKLEGFTMTIC